MLTPSISLYLNLWSLESHSEDSKPAIPFWMTYRKPYIMTKTSENDYQIYKVSAPSSTQASGAENSIKLVSSEVLEQNTAAVDMCAQNMVVALRRGNSGVTVKSINDDTVLFDSEERGYITCLTIQGDYIAAGKMNGQISIINWKTGQRANIKGDDLSKALVIRFLSNSKIITVSNDWTYRIHSLEDDSITTINYSLDALSVSSDLNEKLSELGLHPDIQEDNTDISENTPYPTPRSDPKHFRIWPDTQSENTFFGVAWCDSKVQYSQIKLHAESSEIKTLSLISTDSYIIKSVHPRRLLLCKKGFLDSEACIVEFSPTQNNQSSFSITPLTELLNSGNSESHDPEFYISLATMGNSSLISLFNNGILSYNSFTLA
ncbi:hypothetical protein BB558_004551 [Smittium angustum]|uniref:Anaphase-promoting complex subunit 4 WD40 domain-containing protein n=1 Tax=Smittium angustum TaxID=133377 RepID=A0A2U1J340_SMIAN|nr:hypothetical protein BB558_004551 [Smittium angustum]